MAKITKNMSNFENPFGGNPKETPPKPDLTNKDEEDLTSEDLKGMKGIIPEDLTPEKQEMSNPEKFLDDSKNIMPEGEQPGLTLEKQEMKDSKEALDKPENIMPEGENRAKEDEQALEKGIRSARTIDDLIETFKNTDGIMGSKKLHPSEGVIKNLEFAKEHPDLAKKNLPNLFTRNCGLRDTVLEILDREEAEKEKKGKIDEMKKQIGENELELKIYQDALERKEGKEGNEKLEERIAYAKDKIRELKDNLDILEGEEINSINNVKEKKATIEKIKMKAGKGSKVERGKKFSGICQKDIFVGETARISSSETEKGVETSRIKSIKKCKDGSYIAETTTSFYRLNIAA